MANANGRRFNTPDKDHDDKSDYNCASQTQSGWWYYKSCSELNINRSPPYVGGDMLFTEMKIRQTDCNPSN